MKCDHCGSDIPDKLAIYTYVQVSDGTEYDIIMCGVCKLPFNDMIKDWIHWKYI